jgi:chemotaxis protein methyltransferase CheR
MATEQFFFNKLIDIIYESTGLDCKAYNEDYIKRRINARILTNKLPENDYFAYTRYLEKNLEEVRHLFNALTINVTRFFRDSELWEFLRLDVFPKAIKELTERKARKLNIWSCGCSSGEEPYTIAIILKELTRHTGIVPKIIATDIDEPSLDCAKKGVYPKTALTEVPNEFLLNSFEVTNNENLSAVAVPLKPYLSYVHHNFLNDSPPQPQEYFDMIFCRNVIIYFTPEAKKKVLDLFFRALSPNGWLVIGKTEILNSNQLKGMFYSYNDIERVYRKEKRTTPPMKEPENDKRKNWWFGYESK